MKVATHLENDKTIAGRIGVSPSTVGRWRSGEVDPKPRQVVGFARAYDKNPIEALIAAGYLSEEDLGEDLTLRVSGDLDDVSTFQLMDEVQSRLEAMGEYLSWLHQFGGGSRASAGLSEDVLRYVLPSDSPSSTDGATFIRALEGRLERVDYEGTTLYRPTESNAASENVTRLDDHRFTPVDDERAVASEISEDDGSDEHYDD